MTLAGAAMLSVAFIAGCNSSTSPTTADTVNPGAGGLAAAPIHESQFLELDETYVNPCNGETVHLTGTLVGTSNNVDYLHLEFHATIAETGTGLTTGTSYTSHSTFNEVFNSPTVDALNVSYSFRDAVHVISSSPRLSFTIKHTFHVVVLPSGEILVTKELDSATCQG
jgi:hypothetical protein